MLLHRAHANAAVLGVSGTLATDWRPTGGQLATDWRATGGQRAGNGLGNRLGNGAEMDDIANVEHPQLAIIEPDHQPTVGIHVGRLTEYVH